MFVVLAPGVDADDALRAEISTCVVDALGPSFKPAAGAIHDRAAEDAQREGVAPRDPLGRDRRRARRPVRPRGSRRRSTRSRRARDMTELHRRPRAAAAACAPTTGTRGARCGCAAAQWLERWEPRARAGQRRSRARPRGVPGAVRARGTGNVTSTPRTASACSSLDGRFAGEVSLGSVQRGPFQMGYVGYWIDEALGGQRVRPRRRRADHALRVRDVAAAPARGGDRAPQRGEPAGRREARATRRGHRASASCRSRACTRITSATRSRVEEWRDRGHELVGALPHSPTLSRALDDRSAPCEPASMRLRGRRSDAP